MRAYSPSSITCFFAPVIRDPPKSGSIGVGITLNRGVYVDVLACEELRILFNDREFELPTVKFVAEKLGFKGLIRIRSDLPIGYGFGISGASAFATALAINEFLNLNLSFFRVADIAHVSEVVNRTGLGDIVTQCFGGVVVRMNACCPSMCRVDRFLWSLKLDFLIMERIDTKEVLKENIKNMYKIGRSCLKEFLRKPTVENMFIQSKRFAVECNLIDQRVMDAIEAVESNGGMASMVMLGGVVFALNGDILKEFRGKYMKLDVDLCSARVV